MGEGDGGSARAKGSGWVGVGEDGMVVVRGSTVREGGANLLAEGGRAEVPRVITT